LDFLGHVESSFTAANSYLKDAKDMFRKMEKDISYNIRSNW